MPVLVDPRRLADLGKRFSGRIALAKFPRLRALLQDREGEAVFELRFDRDEQGRPTVRGGCRATLALTCQRCLEEMKFPVEVPISLVVVETLAEMELLPEDVDPLLAEERAIKPLDLLEDELLLALPAVPMHDPESCPAARREGAQGDRYPTGNDPGNPKGPFAKLAELKRK